jgi:pyridoxine kinase
MGPRTVFVTSVAAPDDGIGILSVDDGGAWLATGPRQQHRASGAGDMAAALLMGHRLRGKAAPQAAAATVAAVNALVAQAVADGVRELPIVTAQDVWLNPASDATLSRLDATG